MPNSTPKQLRFPALNGFTVRADFDGGALSSDFGPLLLRGVDQQIGLISRLNAAIKDQRHPSYIDHSLDDLLSQRIFQVACGYADANDANSLRNDPLFKMGVGRKPLDLNEDLASAPTFSRLENAVTPRDLYRMAKAFVDQFITSYASPPEMIVLDMDHAEDPAHGQQELALYHHYYGHHCYLPLFLFEGLSGRFIAAALRPGKRPTGAENAAIVKRVLRQLRQHWPETRILLRGDAHFANVELMQLAVDDPNTDFIFGLTSNAVLQRLARPHLAATQAIHDTRCSNAARHQRPGPHSTRTFHAIDYTASSWPQAFHVALKAEVMSRGENPRFIITSLDTTTPDILYQTIYCARGQDENFIKIMKNDLASDRTSERDVTERERIYQSLEDKNRALHEMLQQIEREKQKVKDDVMSNVEEVLLPILNKLKGKGSRLDRDYLMLLENNLRQLSSSFGRNLIAKNFGLSPREVEIATMIRQGMSTKAIAQVLNISERTTESHRYNIRLKVGIQKSSISLSSYLLSL